MLGGRRGRVLRDRRRWTRRRSWSLPLHRRRRVPRSRCWPRSRRRSVSRSRWRRIPWSGWRSVGAPLSRSRKGRTNYQQCEKRRRELPTGDVREQT
jgi:hypothetical protein